MKASLFCFVVAMLGGVKPCCKEKTRAMTDPRTAKGRKVVNIHDKAAYQVYDLEGEVQTDMSYINLTMPEGGGEGAYVIRMAPGSETIAHTHERNEDYLILEGDLTEPDGTRYGPGDFVHYEPGTRHSSRTEGGCLLIGVDWGRPAPPSGGN